MSFPHLEGGSTFEVAWEWIWKRRRHGAPAPASQSSAQTPCSKRLCWEEQGREAEHGSLSQPRPTAPSMKLWLLSPRPQVLRRKVNPWRPPYDKVFAAVVRAESEERARELVQARAGHEGLGIYLSLGDDEEETATSVWLDRQHTSCIRLREHGRSGVLVIDRREG